MSALVFVTYGLWCFLLIIQCIAAIDAYILKAADSVYISRMSLWIFRFVLWWVGNLFGQELIQNDKGWIAGILFALWFITFIINVIYFADISNVKNKDQFIYKQVSWYSTAPAFVFTLLSVDYRSTLKLCNSYIFGGSILGYDIFNMGLPEIDINGNAIGYNSKYQNLFIAQILPFSLPNMIITMVTLIQQINNDKYDTHVLWLATIMSCIDFILYSYLFILGVADRRLTNAVTKQLQSMNEIHIEMRILNFSSYKERDRCMICTFGLRDCIAEVLTVNPTSLLMIYPKRESTTGLRVRCVLWNEELDASHVKEKLIASINNKDENGLCLLIKQAWRLDKNVNIDTSNRFRVEMAENR
eukprot:360495_1